MISKVLRPLNLWTNPNRRLVIRKSPQVNTQSSIVYNTKADFLVSLRNALAKLTRGKYLWASQISHGSHTKYTWLPWRMIEFLCFSGLLVLSEVVNKWDSRSFRQFLSLLRLSGHLETRTWAKCRIGIQYFINWRIASDLRGIIIFVRVVLLAPKTLICEVNKFNRIHGECRCWRYQGRWPTAASQPCFV